MGWDKGRYYTRSKKINGRVVREYCGVGEVAELAAQMDALQREHREAERAVRRARRAELEALDAPLNQLNDLADLLARAALLVAGFRQHNRGEWRKKRGDCKCSRGNERENELKELQKLLTRAQNGDKTTLPVLRKMLENPAMVDSCGGDLAYQAARSLIDAAAGDNLAFKEALTRKLELLRAELSGPKPTPLERLLIERIVACWLQVQDADVRFAQAKNLSLEWGDYYQRRMDRAHKRYLSVIKTLATVRKLALPVLQVNIAKKQVNVAGPCVAVDGAKEAV